MSRGRIPERLQVWIDARTRHHLSHGHVQMARELGMNPKKLGKIDNHRQERWKVPLAELIEDLYFKRFRPGAMRRSSLSSRKLRSPGGPILGRELSL